MKTILIPFLSGILLCSACGNEKPATVEKAQAEQDTTSEETAVLEKVPKRRVSAKKVYTEDDLKFSKENFKRINAIEKWSATAKKDLEETTEGGEADYYYAEGKLEKIVMRQFGETFQKLTEFYLLEGKPSFVFEKLSTYNRPIYWDSTAMKENGDDQAWDSEKSEISETRNYFLDGELIQQDQSSVKGEPAVKKELPNEERRLLKQFQSLFPEPELTK